MNDIAFKCWFYVRQKDICFCVPAKCGGTAFYRAVFNVPADVPIEHSRSYAVRLALDLGAGPFSPHEVNKYFPDVKRFLIVRDPVDRFMSLWRNKCRRDGDESQRYLVGWTPEQLIDHVEKFPFGNPHWVPQYSYLLPKTKVVRSFKGLLVTTRHNMTQQLADDPEPPKERIATHYAQDMKLWTSTS